ncbi:MAG: T9SS type A sorting domain-containing protein [Flavobacteriia bacterium]|jgi:hypothetical protein
MKKRLLMLMTVSISFGFSQTYTLPIDFESAVVVGSFDNAVGSVVANPSSIGNTSANVGKLVRPSGLTSNYAGSRIMLTTPLNYTTTPILAVKLYSTQPIGYNVICKFEGGTPYEASAVTTKSGEWETLYFNFTGVNSGTNNQMLFMFNAGAPGNGEEYFFDDIELVSSIPSANVVALPIDFETIPVTVGAFDNAIGERIANPFQTGINTSATIGKLTRPNGTSDWAGSRITLTNPIDFALDPFLLMKVYCTEPIGHLVKVKFEGGVPFERDAYTTKSGEWETLTFDFTGQNLGGNNQMLFMFNGGTPGTGQVYYFDDIQQLTEVPGLKINNVVANNFSIYPNPAQESIKINHSNKGQIVYSIEDLSGKTFISNQYLLDGSEINISSLHNGVYIISIIENSQITKLKFLKSN